MSARTAPKMGREFRRNGHTAIVTTQHMGGTCRICGEPVERATRAWMRMWGVSEKAHEACGWLKEEEREPHEIRIPEEWGAFWQWACTTCGREVVEREKRADLRCRKCCEHAQSVRDAAARTLLIGSRELLALDDATVEALPPPVRIAVQKIRSAIVGVDGAPHNCHAHNKPDCDFCLPRVRKERGVQQAGTPEGEKPR